MLTSDNTAVLFDILCFPNLNIQVIYLNMVNQNHCLILSKTKEANSSFLTLTFPAVFELMSTHVSAALSQKMPMVRSVLWDMRTGTAP